MALSICRQLGGLTGQMQENSLTFANTLCGVDQRAIIHGMQGEVDIRRGLLELDSANGIVESVGRLGACGGRGGRAAFHGLAWHGTRSWGVRVRVRGGRGGREGGERMYVGKAETVVRGGGGEEGRMDVVVGWMRW
jgi:hypothetical protein